MQRERSLRVGRLSFSLVCVLVLFAVCGARLAFLMLPADAAAAARESAGLSVELNETRGNIYDARFLPLTGSTEQYYIAAAPTEQAAVSLSAALDEATAETALSRLEEGRPAVVTSAGPLAGAGLTSVLLPVRYSGLAAHLIGYLDGEGHGASGIEKDFDALLYRGESNKVRYAVSAIGDILPGVTPEVVLASAFTDGVVLTIDREIQQICETAAEKIESGAVVVMRVSTGEVVSMVSRPDFLQTDVAASLDDADAPFLNRVLTAYNVGSVFKPLVAAAALMGGVDENLTVDCTGSMTIGGHAFACHKADGHGTVGFREAVAQSCNCFFYTLSTLGNPQSLLDLCKKCGLDSPIMLSGSVVSDAGTLPSAEDLSSPAAAANLAIGQGDLMLTPLHIAGIYSALANGGVANLPRVIRGVIAGGNFVGYDGAESYRVCTAAVAEKVCGFLRATVEEGTGASAQPDNTTAAGKTATAESGWSNGGQAVDQAWFAGFFPAEEPAYTVVVLKENGASGSADCAPVFKEIAEGITELGR